MVLFFFYIFADLTLISFKGIIGVDLLAPFPFLKLLCGGKNTKKNITASMCRRVRSFLPGTVEFLKLGTQANIFRGFFLKLCLP